jgi:uncharacterized protein YcbX
MEVKQLYIYPIKSCQGISLDQGVVTPKGFLGDRQFMLVDAQGNFLTQRQYPLLATIQVKISDDSLILNCTNSLRGKANNSFRFQPTLEGKQLKVKIWSDRTMGIDQGNDVANWFQNALQLPLNAKCRLVRQSDQYPRAIDAKYRTKSDQKVSFADGYPFLLTNTASLSELNRRLQEKYPEQNQQVPMNRFRPNIVMETNEPFIEGTWETLKIGKVIFRIVKPCSRCIVTTTNQTNGERNRLNEPLATLSDFRQVKNQGILFGENMLPETLDTIKIGDLVEI